MTVLVLPLRPMNRLFGRRQQILSTLNRTFNGTLAFLINGSEGYLTSKLNMSDDSIKQIKATLKHQGLTLRGDCETLNDRINELFGSIENAPLELMDFVPSSERDGRIGYHDHLIHSQYVSMTNALAANMVQRVGHITQMTYDDIIALLMDRTEDDRRILDRGAHVIADEYIGRLQSWQLSLAKAP